MSKAASDTLEKVSGEFQGEVMSDLENGKKEALGRIESARKETAEAVAKILENGAKQAESVKRQIIGSAELEARNTQLKALEKAVNEAFEAATKEISGSSGASYEQAIEKLIQEGIDVLGSKASVHCPSKDRRVVAAAIKKLGAKAKLTLEDDSIESMGGVVLASADGTVRFDNTFEARLERMRPELRTAVAGLLTAS